jgi:hypothetical protein
VTDRSTLATFWKGSELSWLEKLCLYSFSQAGYRIKLFATDEMSVPYEGVEVLDYREILDFSPDLIERMQPAFIADIFRLYLQQKTEYVWIDTDMIPISPISPVEGYVLCGTGTSLEDGGVNNAPLRMPSDSEALAYLIGHVENPSLIPEWIPRRARRELQGTPLDQRLVRQGELFRLTYGPRGLAYALAKTGEDRFLQPGDVYSPVPWFLTDILFNPHGGVDGWITERTQVIHIYSNALRQWNRKRPPIEGSYLDRYMRKIGFEFPG